MKKLKAFIEKEIQSISRKVDKLTKKIDEQEAYAREKNPGKNILCMETLEDWDTMADLHGQWKAQPMPVGKWVEIFSKKSFDDPTPFDHLLDATHEICKPNVWELIRITIYTSQEEEIGDSMVLLFDCEETL